MSRELFDSETFSINKILNFIEDGSIQLPNFQRDFNWPESKQKDLAQSIQKGYPTGSLLFMEVSTRPQLDFRPIKDFDAKKDPKYLVLDGQQRVSTIAYIFSGSHQRKKRAYLNLRKLFDLKKKPEEVDLNEDRIIEIKKVKSPSDSAIDILKREELFDLSLVFNDDLYADTLGKFREFVRGKKDKNIAFLSFLDRLSPYLSPFKSYRFPIITISSEADLDVVSTIFTKLNTQGVPLSSFDLCVAKYCKQSNGDFQLKYFLDSEKDKNENLLIVDDDGTNFLQSIALHSGVPNKKAGLVKVLDYDHIRANKKTVLESLSNLGEFFEENLKAEKIEDIPYDAIVPPLSLIFPKWKNKRIDERDKIRAKIIKWIILSALRQRYNEGTDVTQMEDKDYVVPWAIGTRGARDPSFITDPWVIDGDVKRSVGGSRRQALIQLLKMNGALDFISIRPVNERHHIFPKQYLNQEGSKEEISLKDSFLNLTLISKATNGKINGKPPSKYIEVDILESLKAQHSWSLSKAEKNFKEQLELHFIDEKAYEKMRQDDFLGFIDCRAAAFAKYLKNTFGINAIITPQKSGE